MSEVGNLMVMVRFVKQIVEILLDELGEMMSVMIIKIKTNIVVCSISLIIIVHRDCNPKLFYLSSQRGFRKL